MGQVPKLRLSCYLVLLSIDSKTRLQDSHSFGTWPIYIYIYIIFQAYQSFWQPIYIIPSSWLHKFLINSNPSVIYFDFHYCIIFLISIAAKAHKHFFNLWRPRHICISKLLSSLFQTMAFHLQHQAISWFSFACHQMNHWRKQRHFNQYTILTQENVFENDVSKTAAILSQDMNFET